MSDLVPVFNLTNPYSASADQNTSLVPHPTHQESTVFIQPNYLWQPRLAALTAGVVSLAFVLFACSRSDTAAVVEPVRPAYVAAARSGSDALQNFVGDVRAAQRAELSFGVAGLVSTVTAQIGDVVHQGQILASLDDRPQQAQLAAASAELQRTTAQLAEARQRVERMRPAQQMDAASSTEWGAVQLELASAQEAVNAAQAQHQQAAWAVEQVRLRSPINGVVSQRSLERGQATGPGAPVLVVDGGGRELAIQVPGSLSFKPGQAVTLNGQGAALQSRVLRSAERLDAGGVRQVWLAVPDAAQVGSTWSVTVHSLNQGGTQTEVQIPLRAVVPGESAQVGSALRLGADGQTLEKVSLTLGTVTGDWINVKQGLQAGDRVVVAGALALRPGLKVQPVLAKL